MAKRLSNQRKGTTSLKKVGLLRRFMAAGVVFLCFVALLRLQFSPNQVFDIKKSLLAEGAFPSNETLTSSRADLNETKLRGLSNFESLSSGSTKKTSTSDKKPVVSSSSSSVPSSPTIDLLSIGSIMQKDIQDTQQATFGSHKAVRNFFRITEHNDTETDCHANLTMDHVSRIVGFCRRKGRPYDVLRRMTESYAVLNG